MHNSNPIDTTLASNHNLHTTETSAMKMDGTTNRHLVAPLQYLTLTHSRLITRSQLGFVSSWLQRIEGHCQAVKRILLYIKGTTLWSSNHFVHFKPVRLLRCRLGRLCPLTRRSTTRYCIYHGVNCISWVSMKQPIVDRSNNEGGYRSLASTAVELN